MSFPADCPAHGQREPPTDRHTSPLGSAFKLVEAHRGPLAPLGARALDRIGHLTTIFELSSPHRGLVMHDAIPDTLKKDYDISSAVS